MTKPISISTERFTFKSTNHQELRGLIREIFKEHTYYFETDSPKPFILDLGAHVGVSSLYFSYILPHAHIIAVEPNPEIFPLLEQNIVENFIENVTPIQAAVAPHKGTTNLFMDSSKDRWYSTAGFEQGAWNHRQESKQKSVSTIQLSDLITQPVDLLKMDIEGAETEVILRTNEPLRQVQHLILEFHPVAAASLERIVDHLGRFGLKPLEQHKIDFTQKSKLQLVEFARK